MSFFDRFTSHVKDRFSVIPRMIFSKARELGLSISELDLILKLDAFNISGAIYPEISGIADRAGVSVKTLQRAGVSLENKGLIKKSRIRNSDGTLAANAYDLSGLFSAIVTSIPESNQLSLFSEGDLDASEYQEINDRSLSARYGEFFSGLFVNGFVKAPRGLDEFQKELRIDTYESVFLKYLFGYVDQNGICEVSLTNMRKYLPISKTKTAEIVQSLSEKGYIIVREQTIFKKRKSNRYDLRPITKIIDQKEKERYAEFMIEHDRSRKGSSLRRVAKPNEPVQEKKLENNESPPRDEEQINNIRIRIAEIQKQYISKSSERAEEVRELERELSDLVARKKTTYSIHELISSRLPKHTMNDRSGGDAETERAMQICRIFHGNWGKNKDFYLKTVRTIPNSIDRLIGATKELGTDKERYFMKSVANEMRKIQCTYQ